MTKLQFYLSKLASQLWVRPTILSLAAIGWVALSFFSDRFLPQAAKIDITKETLINLFTILASTSSATCNTWTWKPSKQSPGSSTGRSGSMCGREPW